MKKYFKKHVLPRVCITFTITFLVAALLHIVSELIQFIQNRSMSISRLSLVIVGFFFMLCLDAGFDILFEKKNLKSKRFFPILEPIINYLEFIAIPYIFCWQGKCTQELLGVTIILTIYYVNLYIQTRKKCQKEASEINRLIKQRGV